MTTVTATPTRTPDTLLRTTLTANVVISAVWGLGVTLGAAALADPLGSPTVATAAVGVVAILAAALFNRFRTRTELRVVEGWIAAIGDLAFGTGLVAVAVLAPDLTELGRWLTGLSGLAVVDLGLLEAVGTRRLHR